MKFMQDMGSLLAATFRDWYEDRAQRLGAALAYYTIFALTPGLVLVIALAGIPARPERRRPDSWADPRTDWGAGRGRDRGDDSERAHRDPGGGGNRAGVLSVGVRIMGVFGELQDGLNTIWGVTPKAGRRVIEIVKERFWSFAMVVGIGFLLLVSLAMSAWLVVFGTYFGHLLPAPAAALEVLNSSSRSP